MPASYDENTKMYTLVVGSTYDENETSLATWPRSDEYNRQQAASLLNYVAGNLAELNIANSFVGVRCVANDRLPIIGAVPSMPGLYIATALGSRGVLWSALAAAIISELVQVREVAHLQGRPSTGNHASAAALVRLARLGLSADLVAAISPARFLVGALPPALASNSKPILPLGSKAK